VNSAGRVASRAHTRLILKGAKNVEAIGRRLKAGNNCGAGKPEIGKLINSAPVTKPQPA
jgi:assimilatory nitrate reductase catalytic subunit